MRNALRRIRGALGMGSTWAAAGFVAGIGIEVLHKLWPNPLGSAMDIWPAALAYPGFFGGLAFSAVLGLVGRHRRFDELSLPGVAACGALGGAVVTLIPATMVALGVVTPSVPWWQITLALLGPFTLGGAMAASGSLALARKADDRVGGRTQGRQSVSGSTASGGSSTTWRKGRGRLW